MSQPERKLVTLEDIERRLVAEHTKPYYDWLGHVVTLALAALTALVALQGHYVPQSPRLPMLLALGWASLAVTIVSGLFALRSEYATPLAAAKELRTMRATLGDAATAGLLTKRGGTPPNRLHPWAVGTMVMSFMVALVAICAFAIVNLLK
jgi:hypothetical protein